MSFKEKLDAFINDYFASIENTGDDAYLDKLNELSDELEALDDTLLGVISARIEATYVKKYTEIMNLINEGKYGLSLHFLDGPANLNVSDCSLYCPFKAQNGAGVGLYADGAWNLDDDNPHNAVISAFTWSDGDEDDELAVETGEKIEEYWYQHPIEGYQLCHCDCANAGISVSMPLDEVEEAFPKFMLWLDECLANI